MKEAMKLEGFAVDHPMIMFEMLDSDGSGKVLLGAGVRTQHCSALSVGCCLLMLLPFSSCCLLLSK